MHSNILPQNTVKRKPTMGSLFAGIGGFELGFTRAGFDVSWEVEIDPYCQKVLAKNFPEAERFGDIRECGSHNLKPVDVICGGFPCQDISNAGLRAGITGERSGLWKEYARIIRELRPRFVLVENVAALLGRGMGVVLGDLAEIGYDAEWTVISAADVGAPHLRERIWIVAYPRGEGRREDARSTYANEGEHAGRRALQMHQPAGNGEGRGAGNVADANSDDKHGRGGSLQMGRIWRHGEAATDGYSSGAQWSIEPNVGRVAHGVPTELDFIRRVIGAESDYSQAEPTTRKRVWEVLCEMWRHREIAAASPDLYRRRLCDLVPDMPQERAFSGWLLGSRIDEDQTMRNMWYAVQASAFQEAQHLLPELLERIGQKKRPQALGSRVDRLRGLGNSVVPQIPEMIARRIKQALEAQP
jgi:DNA (cytosine-5)-methyltransferase 1